MKKNIFIVAILLSSFVTLSAQKTKMFSFEEGDEIRNYSAYAYQNPESRERFLPDKIVINVEGKVKILIEVNNIEKFNNINILPDRIIEIVRAINLIQDSILGYKQPVIIRNNKANNYNYNIEVFPNHNFKTDFAFNVGSETVKANSFYFKIEMPFSTYNSKTTILTNDLKYLSLLFDSVLLKENLKIAYKDFENMKLTKRYEKTINFKIINGKIDSVSCNSIKNNGYFRTNVSFGLGITNNEPYFIEEISFGYVFAKKGIPLNSIALNCKVLDNKDSTNKFEGTSLIGLESGVNTKLFSQKPELVRVKFGFVLSDTDATGKFKNKNYYFGFMLPINRIDIAMYSYFNNFKSKDKFTEFSILIPLVDGMMSKSYIPKF